MDQSHGGVSVTTTQQGPLVTVIVISHNYGRYLAEAIESALRQTYRPLEVLVIDDGSSDDSVDVARQFADRLRLITQENVGVERTCNRAVDEAQGEYFVRLDADDVLEPNYVEQLMQALDRSPDAAYAYARPLFIGAKSGPMRCLPFSPYFLVKRTNFVHPTALTAKHDFLAVGGLSEDLGEHALEDWDFWLKMLEHGRRGTYVREPLVRWRRHAEGSRNPETGVRSEQAIEFIR